MVCLLLGFVLGLGEAKERKTCKADLGDGKWVYLVPREFAPTSFRYQERALICPSVLLPIFVSVSLSGHQQTELCSKSKPKALGD